VSVLSLFKTLKVDRRLCLLVEGESLLNDGVAVVVFLIVAGVAGIHVGYAAPPIASTQDAVVYGVRTFLWMAGGGLGIGALVGLTASAIIDGSATMTGVVCSLAGRISSTGGPLRVPPKRRPTDDALSFLELLWAMDHGLNLVSKHMHATMGVTGPQRVVIRVIGRSPGLTAGEIAERAHHHPSTLSVVLKSLERNGYVVRAGDPDDHRRVRLFLSPAGQKIDAQKKGTVETAVRTALDGLSPRQILAAKQALKAITEELAKVSSGK